MLSFREYINYYNGILSTAEDIAREYEQRTSSSDAIDYFNFLWKHGYTCIPTDEQGSFGSSGWLNHTRRDPLMSGATGVKKGIGVILSVHGDNGSKFLPEVRIPQPNAADIVAGAAGHALCDKEQLVIVGDIDFRPHRESAVILLHETRHLRNRLGPLFENLPALEPSETHEACTWDFNLNLLDAIGGDPWQRAIERELAWLRKQVHSRPGWLKEEYWATSSQIPPELIQVFGPLSNPIAGGHRVMCTSIAAHVALRQSLGQDRQTAINFTINGLYKSGKKMLEKKT